ncbi:CbtB domain-containing protein [Hydrogenophaga intermedia]|uniref:CbtB domain-containing protein n=1 Tax=Hydrogenophaga intermedia TaxID=65786 RepID=UPI0020437F10|nr:CbtB domain-containing protein [Hydrogenophaga intermedia]MCM3566049.1 CbtB-domain containing protein [Hydrogenophaga intermedia]
MSSQPLTRVFQDVSSESFGVARQLAAAAVVGLVVLYGVAFAESPLLHNAAHDVRHITVKPCH